MSGGRFNYIDQTLKTELFGWCGKYPDLPNVMEDRELTELVYDVLGLIESLDYYKSGDTCEEDYREKTAAFKNKWFEKPRDERLRGYINAACNELRKELLSTIGEKI